jgi:hypothetical protein
LSVKQILAGRGAVDHYLNQTRRGLADYLSYPPERAVGEPVVCAGRRLAHPSG